MSQPTPPQPDLAQVIRQEQRKTRALIAWIFIGIPLVGLVVWGIVAAVSAASAGNAGSSDSGNSVPIVDVTTIPEPLLPPAPAVTTAPLGLSSHCSDLTSQDSVNAALATIVGPQNTTRNIDVGTDLLTECANHGPANGDETVGAALAAAEHDYAAGIQPTPAG